MKNNVIVFWDNGEAGFFCRESAERFIEKIGKKIAPIKGFGIYDIYV